MQLSARNQLKATVDTVMMPIASPDQLGSHHRHVPSATAWGSRRSGVQGGDVVARAGDDERQHGHHPGGDGGEAKIAGSVTPASCSGPAPKAAMP